MRTVHLLINGKVQGVFYRASTKEKAEELHLKGWVKNTPDGSVEVVATGVSEQIELFIDWCRQGPSRAKVVDVAVEEKPLTHFETFSIMHS